MFLIVHKMIFRLINFNTLRLLTNQTVFDNML